MKDDVRRHGEKWSDKLKKNLYTLYLAARDPRISPVARMIAGLVIAYALSPIDLIPDFIPIVGYVDDIILLPLGVWLAIRIIPKETWRELEEKSRNRIIELESSNRGVLVVITIWLIFIGVIVVSIWKYAA